MEVRCYFSLNLTLIADRNVAAEAVITQNTLEISYTVPHFFSTPVCIRVYIMVLSPAYTREDIMLVQDGEWSLLGERLSE